MFLLFLHYIFFGENVIGSVKGTFMFIMLEFQSSKNKRVTKL